MSSKLAERLKRAGLAGRELAEALDVLTGAPGVAGQRTKYDPDWHPQEMVRFFREAYDRLAASPVREIGLRSGDVKFVREPLSVPSLAKFASHLGVSSTTLTRWKQEHLEFADAWDLCADMAEDLMVELGLHGAIQAGPWALTMKNRHGWQEKVEQTTRGGVILRFDPEDGA